MATTNWDVQYSQATTDIEVMRHMVDLFSGCSESFNARFTLDELMALFMAYAFSEWDILPGGWTEAQVQDALRYNISPAFYRDTETAITYEATEDDLDAICREFCGCPDGGWSDWLDYVDAQRDEVRQ